jgi:hypothetical protein
MNLDYLQYFYRIGEQVAQSRELLLGERVADSSEKAQIFTPTLFLK